MKIDVKVKDKEIKELFGILQIRLSGLGMEPVMEKIGNRLLSNWRLNWKKEKDPYEKPWKPLSDLTIARRKKGKQNLNKRAQILRDSGRLFGSYNVEAFGDRVEIGTNVLYARTHQFGAKKGKFGTTKRGTPIPWGNIPARKMLPDRGLPHRDWEQIKEILESWILKK